MEIVTGALPSVIAKLGDLLVGEYNLQKGVKGGIRFLKSELESMKVALETISGTPPDQLDKKNKIWARHLSELAYDIEDKIDTFIVHVKGHGSPDLHGIKKLVHSLDFFRKIRIRHKNAIEIRDIKNLVLEVHERRQRYDVDLCVRRATTATMVDPRIFHEYTDTKELVGIEESRDELIKELMDGNGAPLQQSKIVSIVGFGGLGKTTLAKVVYEKIKGSFDCCAFVSVSQTPDLKRLLKGLLYDLGKNINEETLDERQVINVIREFLQMKRYLIVIDDIWDISAWKVIKCALADNDLGHTVITTTRIASVAENVGGPYNMKALSQNNSRKLLYRKVFGSEKCPDEELAEVSNRILKKCAGVPLAVITMASLLACKPKNKMDWYDVYHSIGTGLEHNQDVENMRKILSFSYYNMPSHMRTCLLYLGMFPEDYKVQKGRLIWMWIAEGFIQCEEQGKSLFELGESYFNQLINRSMIQPTYDEYDMVDGCRVHDMVLDLICSISSEANFVTILNGNGHVSSSSKIRRLSIQNGMEDESMTPAQRTLQHVRSIMVLRSITSQIPDISSFQVLRVMDLQGCDLSHGYNLNMCLGNLFHLRHLRLCETGIVQLPQETGNLQFLEVLDICCNKIACLPSTIVQLKHLMCLNKDYFTRMPKGFGSLTSLEELSDLGVVESNMDIIEELGQLTELRVLCIHFLLEYNDKLADCLCKLQKIQYLTIWAEDIYKMGGLDAWVAPRCLRGLDTDRGCWFQTLPAWINPSHLPNLSMLSISVRKVQQADLDMLGKLPALQCLILFVHKDHEDLGEFLVGAGSFSCLRQCQFRGFGWPVVFQHGAMPNLGRLYLQLSIRLAREIASSNNGVLDLGLGNLASLQDADVYFHAKDVVSYEEWDELEAALKLGIKIHPNHPCLSVKLKLWH